MGSSGSRVKPNHNSAIISGNGSNSLGTPANINSTVVVIPESRNGNNTNTNTLESVIASFFIILPLINKIRLIKYQALQPVM